jgi:hypothetical protein
MIGEKREGRMEKQTEKTTQEKIDDEYKEIFRILEELKQKINARQINEMIPDF